jgi:NSS family neurotransmitter:Na+ symporter
MAKERAQWGSRLGFILAAAGSAVGLGNMWKFPYITGENGGGIFVLIYLVCILVVGLPIMIGEVMLGRMTRSSPVGAFKRLSDGRGAWVGVGFMGVATAFIILSYYSVVAGWALHYGFLAVKGSFASGASSPEQIEGIFEGVSGSKPLSLGWHLVFMILTIAVVIGGIRKGVERAARILMPALFVLMGAMLVYAMTLDGFGKAADFVFGAHLDALSGASVLEALGHSFFTLSLGMGAMLTYGSYLQRTDDAISASIAITILDTAVALMACLVLFPITFTHGMEPSAGPGLVFQSMPVAFSQMPGGMLWSIIFFALLIFAALSSSISMLEVASAYFIDSLGWGRRSAVLVCGAAILFMGIPSAMSGEFFGHMDYITSNWMLPLGGLGIAVFMAWRVGGLAREAEFAEGSKLGKIKGLYLLWLQLLRYFVPVAILFVMLSGLGLFDSPAPYRACDESCEGAETCVATGSEEQAISWCAPLAEEREDCPAPGHGFESICAHSATPVQGGCTCAIACGEMDACPEGLACGDVGGQAVCGLAPSPAE